MKLMKGNREFTIELDGSRVVVTEGEERVEGTLCEGSTIIKFPKPNPNIRNGNAALDGLSITLEQSKDLNELRNDFFEKKNKENDKKRSIPEMVRFSFGESFQVRVSTKNVRFDFIDKMRTINCDWLRSNSEQVDRTTDDYAIYEIASKAVLSYLVSREARIAKERQEMEGKIAYNECWECGRTEIVGWFKDGKQERIPSELFHEMKESFVPSEGVKVMEYYCGC